MKTSNSKPKKRGLQDQKWNYDDPIAGMYRGAFGEEKEVETEEDRELDQKLPDVADAVSNRDCQPRKVDFREKRRVSREVVAVRLRQAEKQYQITIPDM